MGEQTGVADWQTFNGVAFTSSQNNTEGTRTASVSHHDSILDMALLELSTMPVLVTCGRDSQIKIWN